MVKCGEVGAISFIPEKRIPNVIDLVNFSIVRTWHPDCHDSRITETCDLWVVESVEVTLNDNKRHFNSEYFGKKYNVTLKCGEIPAVKDPKIVLLR